MEYLKFLARQQQLPENTWRTWLLSSEVLGIGRTHLPVPVHPQGGRPLGLRPRKTGEGLDEIGESLQRERVVDNPGVWKREILPQVHRMSIFRPLRSLPRLQSDQSWRVKSIWRLVFQGGLPITLRPCQRVQLFHLRRGSR